MLRRTFLLGLSLTSLALHAQTKPYDPLAVGDEAVSSLPFEVTDAARDRTIPIRVYLPQAKGAAPVVLFSHGLGGSRDNNPYLGQHWARRGYVVVCIQHRGSDEAVWKNAPLVGRMQAMQKAASAENYLLRVKDVPAVIDALTKWNQQPGHDLQGRLDPEHIGMSGHSFGAVTTQAMAGQDAGSGRVSFVEKRIDAALMMSPSPPKVGEPAKAFDQITIPCLLMTGTEDNSPIGNTQAAERLKVFPNLGNAPAWQIVFDKANHMSFGERARLGAQRTENRYHSPILALSTAFWDATLRGDKAAKEWLNGEGARKVLAQEDQWQINDRAREK